MLVLFFWGAVWRQKSCSNTTAKKLLYQGRRSLIVFVTHKISVLCMQKKKKTESEKEKTELNRGRRNLGRQTSNSNMEPRTNAEKILRKIFFRVRATERRSKVGVRLLYIWV